MNLMRCRFILVFGVVLVFRLLVGSMIKNTKFSCRMVVGWF